MRKFHVIRGATVVIMERKDFGQVITPKPEFSYVEQHQYFYKTKLINEKLNEHLLSKANNFTIGQMMMLNNYDRSHSAGLNIIRKNPSRNCSECQYGLVSAIKNLDGTKVERRKQI